MKNRFKFLPVRRIIKERKAVAMIEFALSLPVFLTLVLGGIEAGNLAMGHLKASQIAVTVADNASRVDPSIDETDIYEIMAGAEVIGDTVDFESRGRIILSSLQSNMQTGADEGQMINWQRCWGELPVVSKYGPQDTGRDDDALKDGMGSDTNKIKAQDGTAVMYVEVVYLYKSLVASNWLDKEIRYETAYNVRSRDILDISNVQGLPLNDCSVS